MIFFLLKIYNSWIIYPFFATIIYCVL